MFAASLGVLRVRQHPQSCMGTAHGKHHPQQREVGALGEKVRKKVKADQYFPQQTADQRPPELEIAPRLLQLTVLCGFLFYAVIFFLMPL